MMGCPGDADVHQVTGRAGCGVGLVVAVEQNDVVKFEPFGLAYVGDFYAWLERKFLIHHPP